MEVDDVGVSDDIYPDSPNQDIFNQMVNDEVCVANAMLPNPVNILNVSQIPSKDDLNNVWSEANHTSDKTKDTVIEKPIGKAKFKSKKEDNTAIWLPTYTVGELRCELMILKMGLPVNSAFRQKIHLIQSLQKSEAAKMKLKQIIEADKKKFDYHDEEMEMKLKNGDELGFRGFNSPTSYDGFDENVAMDIIDEQIEEANQGDFLSYQDIQNDMERYKQNQQDIINEQGLMLKRVQQWHENLRPILEEEEKRTEFDIHEYGTRLLNCFKSIGEQKTFKELIELVGGSAQVEVSRYFLSTLMMTNTYNLKLTKSSDGEMIIELLKKERHHEELQVNIGNQVNQEPK
uniref:Condensin-2 complex subunit H2 n=2 Tax=Sipha flava TaxID=143950 RepID=A0A2S2Q7A7_9HEMI